MPVPTPTAGQNVRNPNESTLYDSAIGLGMAPCVKISRNLRDFHAVRKKLFTFPNPVGIRKPKALPQPLEFGLQVSDQMMFLGYLRRWWITHSSQFPLTASSTYPRIKFR
jgi:hypothetical protein